MTQSDGSKGFNDTLLSRTQPWCWRLHPPACTQSANRKQAANDVAICDTLMWLAAVFKRLQAPRLTQGLQTACVMHISERWGLGGVICNWFPPTKRFEWSQPPTAGSVKHLSTGRCSPLPQSQVGLLSIALATTALSGSMPQSGSGGLSGAGSIFL
jgi:hypothetical protein